MQKFGDNLEFEEKLRVTLWACLGLDDALRKEGETTLQTLMKQQPEQVALSLLKLMRVTHDETEKMFATILLKNQYFSQSGKKFEWKNLSLGCKAEIKVELLDMFLSQNMVNQSAIRQLQSCIAQLAVSLSNEQLQNAISDTLSEKSSNQEEDQDTVVADTDLDQSGWPEFIPFLWKLFEHQDLKYHSSALYIMKQLVQDAPNIFDGAHPNLLSILSYGINSSSIKVQIESLELIGACAESMDSKFKQELQKFVPKIASIITNLIQNEESDSFEEIIDSLTTIAISAPSVLSPYFDLIFSTVRAAIMHENEDFLSVSLLQNFTNFLITLTENVYTSKVLRKQSIISKSLEENFQVIHELIEFVLKIMKVNEYDIPDDFFNPPNEINPAFEKEFTMEDIVFGIGAIHRLFDIVGGKMLIPILLTKITSKLEEAEDANEIFAALIALSEVLVSIDLSQNYLHIEYCFCLRVMQLSEYLENSEDAQKIIQDVILPELESKKNDHFIMCALLRLIMKFTQKEIHHFLNEKRSTVISLLFGQLEQVIIQHSLPTKKGFIPARIIVQMIDVIAAMLDNCSESEKNEILETRKLYKIVITLIEKNQLSYVQESGIRAITKISSVLKSGFFDNSFETTCVILQNILSLSSIKYLYFLKVEAFSSLAMISKQAFEGKYTTAFVSLLDSIVKNVIQFQNELSVEAYNEYCSESQVRSLQSSLILSWLDLVDNWSEQLREHLKPIVKGIQDMFEQLMKDFEDYKEPFQELIVGFNEKFIAKFGLDFMPFFVRSVMQAILGFNLNEKNEQKQEFNRKCVDMFVRLAKGNPQAQRDISTAIVNRILLEKELIQFSIIEIRILSEFLEINGVSLVQEDQVGELNSYFCKQVKNQFLVCKRDNKRINRNSNNDSRIQVEGSELDNLLEAEKEGEDSEWTQERSEINNTIVNLIRVLIKTQRDQANELIEIVAKELTSKRFFGSKSIQQNKLFGIELIQCLIEGNSKDKVIHQRWVDFAVIITELLRKDDSSKVRITAAKIIPLLIENIPTDSKDVHEQIHTMIETLVLSSSSSQNSMNESDQPNRMHEDMDNEKEIDAKLTRNASIASIGRIIKKNSVVISQDVVVHWIKNLLLIDDKEVSREQIVDLVGFVSQKQKMYLDSSEVIEQVICVLVSVIETKMAADVKEAILILSKTENAKSNWESILSKMTEKQILILKKIVF